MTIAINSYPNNSSKRNISYVADSAVSSAVLGASIQGCMELKHIHDCKKIIKDSAILTSIRKDAAKSVMKSAGYSALLGLSVSSIFCLFNMIKSKIQNK